jgi:inorganic triphosphatase YgiF
LARFVHPRLRDRLGRLSQSDQLREVFRTEFKRRIFPLSVGPSQIEMAVDSGRIESGDRQEPLSEVELELKSGEPEAVFALANRLVEALPLHIEHRTKAHRGYALAAGRVPGAALAGPLALDPEATVWSGFVAVVRNCLAQLYANEIAVLAGSGADSVHQMRVSVRRLRAAFSAFGRALPQSEVDAHKGDLRWLQQTLGPARDWDVFISETLKPLQSSVGAHEGLGAFARATAAARRRAYEEARATLRSQRYAQFQIRLEKWLGGEGVGVVDARLSDFAAQTLAKRDKKLRKAAKGIAGLSDTELHAVRIFAKKARYSAEFFRSLYARKAVRRYVRALREVQDCLGALNDAAVARTLIASLDAPDASTQALFDGWFAARVADGKRRIADAWGEFRRTPRHWEA